MTTIKTILDVRNSVVGRIRSSDDIRVALCAPANVTFTGKPMSGAKAYGYLFTSDMGVESDSDLRTLAGTWKKSGLREAVGPNPSAIIAWTVEGADAKVFLYQTHTDKTGTHNTHEFLLDDGRRVLLGSVVISFREILPDGSLGPVSEQPTPYYPGNGIAKPDLPHDAPSDDVIAMAVENMRSALVTSAPTDQHLLAWLEAHPTVATPASEERTAQPAETDRDSRDSLDEEPQTPLKVDLRKLAALIEPLRRTTFVPILGKPASASDTSKSGRVGLTFIPAGTEWPTVRDILLHPIVQLHVASLPQEARDLLGGTGLFQFFCGPSYSEANDTWLARVVDPASEGSWQAMPDEMDEAVPVVIEGWEERVEAPCRTEFHEGPVSTIGGKRLSEAMGDAISHLGAETIGQHRLPPEGVQRTAKRLALDPQEAEAVADLLTHYESNKLLGWPTWTQAPEWQGDKRNPKAASLAGRPFAFAASDVGFMPTHRFLPMPCPTRSRTERLSNRTPR
jgi:hypothetical protein